MPKLIVTSRYLKKGAVKKLQNYVKYIATREGSVPVKENSGNEPATENQCELIVSLLREFPDSTQTFAYEDYSKASTQKNASALISEIIENNVDRIGERENYIGYLANRPGAMKFDTHALFSQEDTAIDLNAVAKEIANHCGNVWTHVVALRRDNAQQMGYDNLTAWRELVKRQIPNIAKAQKIDMQNLRWYAAFHDKETNPHVHIVVYSTDVREGFLTKKGIEQIRSGFANDIYQDELHHLYARQTEVRDLLKKESAELMQRLSAKVQSNTSFEPELCQMIQLCRKQLQESKGKKVYGYLKPEVIRTVDRIFELLASNESIQKMYGLWCEMEQQKHDVYSSAKITPPALIENPQFKSVKNMIIRAVLDMNMPEPSLYSAPQNDDSDDTAFSDIDNDVFTWNNEDAVEVEVESSNLHIQWSKDYKRACKLYYKKDATDDEKEEAVKLLHSEAEKGNVLAIHDLGKVYADDKEKSYAYYKQALDGFLELEPMSQKLQPYLQYRIGKMYCYGMGTKQNYAESFGWFLKSAYAGNKFAQFSLANQYYYGNGFYKDKQQALHWYMKAAEQGLPYAAYAVAQMYANGEAVLQDESKSQQYYAQALAGFLKLQESDRADDNLLYKLGRMYRYGLGTDENISKALEYLSRSAKHGNANARRMIAIEQLSDEYIPQDVNKAVETLTELAENGDVVSAYRLGKLYLFGADGIERDVLQAMQWLAKSAEDGNEYAQQLLDNMEQRENAAFASTIFGLFVNLSHAIEDDYNKSHKKLQSKVDSKIQRMIRKHKQELGIRDEHGMSMQ